MGGSNVILWMPRARLRIPCRTNQSHSPFLLLVIVYMTLSIPTSEIAPFHQNIFRILLPPQLAPTHPHPTIAAQATAKVASFPSEA